MHLVEMVTILRKAVCSDPIDHLDPSLVPDHPQTMANHRLESVVNCPIAEEVGSIPPMEVVGYLVGIRERPIAVDLDCFASLAEVEPGVRKSFKTEEGCSGVAVSQILEMLEVVGRLGL